MAAPVLSSVTPAAGPTSGGDLVRLVGSGFAARVAVWFGTMNAEVRSVRLESGVGLVDVVTPPHPEGLVAVTVENLDAAGAGIPGEVASLPDAYRFARAALVGESNLTRVIRALLRMLKAQVAENTSMAVAVDYDATPDDALRVVTLATLPSLVLSGPTVRESRFYATNVLAEDVVPGLAGPELLRRRPALTVDLAFVLTAASDRTAELLNLMASVASFLNRNRWLTIPRDPDHPERGVVRWELDPEGEFRTNLRGQSDVRVFTAGLVVRGFDLDEGLPMDLGKAVAGGGPDLSTQVLGGGP